MLLPHFHTVEEYDQAEHGEAQYLPAMEAICQRHRLPHGRLVKYPRGSTIVFALGETHVIKLFAPLFREHWRTEATVLQHLHTQGGVPTPRVDIVDELDEWGYLVMAQCPGQAVEAVWAGLTVRQRQRLCAELGAVIARLHAVPPQPLDHLQPEWTPFLAAQRHQCVTHHRARGAEDRWLQQMPEYLASIPLTPGGPVLLHTEVMRSHVFVAPCGARWVITGLIDFEPAMLGHPEYEFAAVGVFLSAGDVSCFRAFLEGYGYGHAAHTEGLPDRLMVYALLHRYSNLRWFLECVPPPSTVQTLPELAAFWWGTGG